MKIIDIASEQELEQISYDLKQKVFDIYLAKNGMIEAKFSHNNYLCWDLFRELIDEGWEYREQMKIRIMVPGFEKTLPSE